jgi:hypothetical protein
MEIRTVNSQQLLQMGHEHMQTLQQKGAIYAQYKEVMQTAKEQEKTITVQMKRTQTNVLSVLDHEHKTSFIALAVNKKRPPLGTNIILELVEQYTREKLLEEFMDAVPLVACKKFLSEELMVSEQIKSVEDLSPEMRQTFNQRVSTLHEQFSHHIRSSIPHLIQRFVYDQIISKMNIQPDTLTEEKKTLLAADVQRTHDRMLAYMTGSMQTYNINSHAQEARTGIQHYINKYREENTESFSCIKVKKKLNVSK